MKIMCVDLEASGLGPESWPIEIGLAWIEDDKIHSDSRLIRPDPSWSLSAWSDQSEKVHGITQEDLEGAPTVNAVETWFLEMTSDQMLLSDAPEFDSFWLSRCVDIDVSGIALLDYHATARATFGDVQGALHRVFRHRAKQKTVHRAEPDARDLAAAWRAGLRYVQRREPERPL